MPIVFKLPTFAPKSDNPLETLTIQAEIRNSNGAPMPSAKFTAVVSERMRMFFKTPPASGDYTGTANDIGLASIEFESFDTGFSILNVSATTADSNGSYPIGIYDEDEKAIVRIDGAIVEDGVKKIQQNTIAQNGITIQIEFEEKFKYGDIVFFCIEGYYVEITANEGDTYVQLSLPAGFANENPLISGEHYIFYGVLSLSGNSIIPSPTKIEVIGEPVTSPLLPVTINNDGVEYINKRDDRIGVKFIIATEQKALNIGDTWELWYTLTNTTGGNNNNFEKVLMGSGTIEEKPNPGGGGENGSGSFAINAKSIEYTTTPGYFQNINNGAAWFAYTVKSKEDSIKRVSTPVRRLIET